MELCVVSKIKKRDDIIATYGDELGYVKVQESDGDNVISKFKDIPSEKIKKLILSGKIDNEELVNMLDKRVKCNKFVSENGTVFKYKNKTVFPMPDLTRERELLYVHGASGSGKSFFTKMYAKLYRKHKKGNDVFILSHVEKDPSFEGLKYHRIPIELDKLEAIDLETLANSLIIFDDTDTPRDKELQKLIDCLKDDIAQRGRHHNISAIFTTHMACNYTRTRVLLNECDKFVIFPNSGGAKQQEYLVCNYGGMDKNFFKNLKSYKSRWMMFSVRCPNYVVYQDGVSLLT